MTWRFAPPLKYAVPLLLILFFGVLSAAYLYFSLPRAEQAITKRYIGNLSNDLSGLQGTIEYLWRKNDLEGIRREIAAAASNPENQLIALVNEELRIITATRLAWVNRHINEIAADFDDNTAHRAISRHQAQIQMASNRRALLGYTSINLGSDQHQPGLRPTRTGILFFVKDLVQVQQRTRMQILNQSLYWLSLVGLLALLLGIIFHFLLTRRVGKIVQAADLLAQGNLHCRSGLHGHDELAQLSNAFDAMADNIAASQTRLNQDIAERKRVEKHLRESETRIHQILNNASALVYVKALDGRLFFINQLFENLFKVSYKDTIGRTENAVLPAAIAEELRKNDLLILKNKHAVEFETEFHLAEKTHNFLCNKFPLLTSDGEIYAICTMATDIGSLKQVERVLQSAALGVSQAAGKQVFDMLVQQLANTMDVDYALIGLLCGEDQIETLSLWAHGEIAANFRYDLTGSPCETVVKQQFRCYPDQIQQRFPQDTLLQEIAVESYSALPLFDTNGHALGLIAILDSNPLQNFALTESIIRIFANRAENELERKRVDAALRSSEEQLRQAQKMEAIGQLTGGIAHDFNNILTSVLGNAELGLQSVSNAENPQLEKYLNNIHRSGERARELVQQMLTFSRGQHSETRIISLSPLVQETVSLMRATLPSSMEISITTTAPLSCVKSDPVQVEQLLMNLTINARDAMQGKGSVTITLSDQQLHNSLCSSCRQMFSGHFVSLAVNDNGSGIETAALERLFEPFYTTKEVGKGTGMGLAMVHGIIHKQGGHIVINTTVDQGSTFNILFPAQTQVVSALQNDNEVYADFTQLTDITASILVVDDEELVAEYLSDLLQNHGLDVTTMTNSDQALQHFLHNPGAFDLVILDQTMPKITGLELARQILQEDPEIPIILYTGHSDNLSAKSVRQLGIRGYLHKPLDSKQLLRTIATLLNTLRDDV